MLSANDILNKQDFKTDLIKVPEWGGSVKIRSLSAKDVNDLISNDSESITERTVKTIIAGCIDSEGNKLFSDDNFEALSDKSQNSILFLSSKILELTGLAGETKKK